MPVYIKLNILYLYQHKTKNTEIMKNSFKQVPLKNEVKRLEKIVFTEMSNDDWNVPYLLKSLKWNKLSLKTKLRRLNNTLETINKEVNNNK